MPALTFLRRRRLGKGSTSGIIAAARDNELCEMRVARSWLDEEVSPEDWMVRWGCTAVANHPGHRTLNGSQSIHWCADKTQSRLDMGSAGVSVPYTIANEELLTNRDNSSWPITGKVIVRPQRHAQGKNMIVCDMSEATELIYEDEEVYGTGYTSAFIDKVAEYRVFVIQGRVAWVARKTPADENAVAWNVAQGGSFDNVRWGQWPCRVVEQAIRAAAACPYRLDFCGVDVMVDEDGTPFVLEVNSAPSQTSPYRQLCVAKCLDYIVRNDDKAPIPVSDFSRWRGSIHPALLQDEDD